MTCLERGIRLLRGSYYNDRPEGFVTLEREDGSWIEGFCLDGLWDGLVREFDSDRNMKVRGSVDKVTTKDEIHLLTPYLPQNLSVGNQHSHKHSYANCILYIYNIYYILYLQGKLYSL